MNTLQPSFFQSTLTRIGLGNAHQALSSSVKSWVLIALIGQWMFALYVFLLFGKPVLMGNPEEADFSHAITGYIEGDGIGNFMLFAHVIPAAIISMSGIFQLMPYVRAKMPSFHRWNGRVFLTLGMAGALTGLYLTWVRGSRLSDIGGLGITLNGILIPIAVVLAWQYARKKQFALHSRWAIHAFLLINGVWTFRLYLMAWFMINQGANGNSRNLDGPADIALSFACYLLPMLFAEIFFWAQRQQQDYKKVMVSCLMFVGAAITLIGVVGAWMSMWSPRILENLGLT